VGAFNGEEPSDASDFPNASRFGDSWSGRMTVFPFRGAEVQAGYAWVESAEQPRGNGLDQRKWSASVRFERATKIGAVYALAEWARTAELQNGTSAFELPSMLVEASLRRGAWLGAARVERTERTEEERLEDPYRTPWPHADIRPIGRTRWTNASVHIERRFEVAGLAIEPFVEAGYARVKDTVPRALFVARDHFGSNTIRSLSAGARVATDGRHRMGRYGAARDASQHMGH
jgi:hypothetical protein